MLVVLALSEGQDDEEFEEERLILAVAYWTTAAMFISMPEVQDNVEGIEDESEDDESSSERESGSDASMLSLGQEE